MDFWRIIPGIIVVGLIVSILVFSPGAAIVAAICALAIWLQYYH